MVGQEFKEKDCFIFLFFISFIFIDVNVYRFKYEKQIVIEQIIYYVRLYKKKTQKVKV